MKQPVYTIYFGNDCSKVPADTRRFFLDRLAAKAEENITTFHLKSELKTYCWFKQKHYQLP